ncbi:unnamed protein product [Ambrosiozyma monospora]|uniref:Unnamed protein product n=1 Tax=Ambrosiozyma monospora TaxID=43982 RepID=A0A9W7DHD1_AMBMO|nr:unnamed protein product [Ambrosiozyma monospora]
MGDTYRWKSENVSTSEVANEILRIDEIEQCIVVGAKIENHEGRCGYAILQTMTGNQEKLPDKLNILNKVADQVFNHLPHYARPCFIRFDTIKLNENHKISTKAFRNPTLPLGKTGKWEVFYLDNKTKSYKVLDESTYENIVEGRIRI